MTIVDPKPESFNHCFATVNGVKYHYIDEGDSKGTPLILYHGFPDLWYGWRHQIVFLKEHGFRVIVPSLRGYNQTEPGIKLEDFGLRKISDDAMALLTELGIERVIVIGHDWGGALAWRTVLHHPQRVLAVASLYLNDEKCIPELDAEPERFFNVILRKWNEETRGFKSWWDKESFPPTQLMSAEAMQYYVDNYRQSGFRGPTSWYRTLRINYEDGLGVDTHIPHPALMVTNQ
ncbi:Alpha/Beta hydrolase protein [Syncephalis plumigaleata]|nr:Alpha/Beta hydrolase protein [Syncephalis plumigaleata]